MFSYFIIDNKNLKVNNSLTKVLEDLPEFKCAGIGHDYLSSMNDILKESPDLIFINIDSEDSIDPFDFAKEVNEYLNDNTEFIAISATKDRTYESIKTGFFDYLLMPTTDLDIRKTVLRFKKKRPTKSSRICLKSYKDYRYLNTDEILFLRADNNTTDFHMADGSVVNSFKTLKTYQTILPKNFLRVHKSYIINSNFVSRINYGNLKCSFKKYSQKVPFTKFYKKNVDHMLNSIAALQAV
ncbi:LytR/AlgR family response regulator transcription factor [Seonamhaeicola marinus]|uniref:DNA-binding response regulator n=1 Tax=Seonamhaeicola marinus TaxID=1912246 RepID=A0A5D0IVH7_9FLAO|nr:LytTR family transcriptional regulator DNA-binding domain-containing protein [Seonamhaeicola marinus]TYA86810.1 DNA-binding response regulator [Seonamhaeicola marinus]